MRTPGSPFSIRDVFADAWGTYRRTFTVHLGWSVAFIAVAVLLTCLSSCLLVPMAAIGGVREGGGEPITVLAMVVLYVVLLVGFFGLYALHQGVTLEIARADRRGERALLDACVRDATGRLPTMAGVVFARLFADLVVSVPLVFGALALIIAIGVEGGSGSSVLLLGALCAAYAGAWAWMLVVRAFLGLASPCAQYEGVGVIAALRRSAQLLAGRRLQLVGLRLAWLLLGGVIYLLGFVPTLVLIPSGDEPDLGATLLTLPMMLLGYLVALQLLSFDTLLESALHARVTEKRSADELAAVFL